MTKLNLSLISEGRLHSTKQSFIPQSLQTSTHVWLRTESGNLLRLLTLNPTRKILHNREFRRKTPHSLTERLKPVTLLQNHKNHSINPPLEQPKQTTEHSKQSLLSKRTTTRSGRRVYFSKNNNYFYFK